MPRIVVLDGYCLNPGDLSWSALEQHADVAIYDRTPAAEVVHRASEADAILTNKTPITRETLAQLPQLKYIGVLATGYNIVDTQAAAERQIPVTNIPTYGTASVAQFAIAMLLELCHHVGMHSDAVRAGEWSRNPDWSFWKSPLVELEGKTIGIVGYGRIGRQTAKIADALGMRVMAHDAQQSSAPAYTQWASLDSLLREADAISLHCPLTPTTNGLINAERLKLMKASAFLVNTSRGPLVIDQDLADALNDGVIAGAALDVLSVEPPLGQNPLLTARNCIVTPHIAWATKEARARLMEIAVQNVSAWLSGKPQNVVNRTGATAS